MPQICQLLGANSVTNIELTKGFMPALICIFADWLEKFSMGDSERGLPVSPVLQGVSGRTSYSKVAICP